MANVEDLKQKLQIKGYKVTESVPSLGEFLLKEGRGGNLIMEVDNFNRDNIKSILADLHFKIMIREKAGGKSQFIIKS